MPAPGRIRISKNSQLSTPLLDYRGVANNFIAWDGQFQIAEFENDDYLEFDFEENEWYFNLYATLPGTYLNNLLDVTITNLTNKDVLNYNILTQQWENSGRLTQSEQNIASINVDISNINQTISTNNQSRIDGDTTLQNQINTINSQIGSINSGSTGSLGGFVPEGGIIMWSGMIVPKDWALCDGTNGTPDLTDKFIIGANMNDDTPFAAGGVGSPTQASTISVGGTSSFKITSANLPPHTHGPGTLNITSSGGHGHTVRTHYQSGIGGGISTTNSASDPRDSTDRVSGGSHTHPSTNFDGVTSDGGFANTPVNIPISMSAVLQPKTFYTLAFIMRKYGTASFDYDSNTTVNNSDTNTNIGGGLDEQGSDTGTNGSDQGFPGDADTGGSVFPGGIDPAEPTNPGGGNGFPGDTGNGDLQFPTA